MKDSLLVHGRQYVRLRIAALGTDLSHDYIAKFCRRGAIRAIQESGLWYVDQQSLQDFLRDHRASKDEWKRRQSERRRAEQHAFGFASAVAPSSISSLPKSRVAPAHLHVHVAQARRHQTRKSSLIANSVAVLVLVGFVFAGVLSVSPVSQSQGSYAAVGDVADRFESLAQRVFDTLCPIFGQCPSVPAPVMVVQQPRTTSQPKATVTPQVVQQTVVNNPVVERVRETVRTVIEHGISATRLSEDLAELEARLENRITASNTATLSSIENVSRGYAASAPVGGGGAPSPIYQVIAQSNNIDKLGSVDIEDSTITGGTITEATITGGSVAAASISGTISNVIDSLVATFTDLTATTLTATNATITNSTTTNATTTNLYATSLTAANATTTNALYVTGNLTVAGNSTTLGTSTATMLAINSSISSNLIPDLNATRDLGSTTFYWDDAYIDTLTVNNISAASTTIGGTQSETFTINSDNATADTENASIIFFRGTVVPNAIFAWDAGEDRFEINQPVSIAASSTVDGNFGIGTSSPYAKLSVVGQTVSSYFTATTSQASTFPFASTTGLSVSGTGFFGTATTTNLIISSAGGSGTRCLQVGADGTVSANASACSSGSSDPFTHPATGQSATTSLMFFSGAASSTLFSANYAQFGATATTTFTTDGKVGIGTTSPWAKLSVEATEGSNSFAIGSSTSSYFVVNSSGNIGIGTASPGAKLTIADASIAAGSRFLDIGDDAYLTDLDTANTLGVYGQQDGTIASLKLGSGGGTISGSGGFIGIADSSPSYTLDVGGNINFTGKLYEDGVEILSSMIAPFASSCPTGWTEYTAARGRTVVGTPSGGTIAGTVGSALSNLGTRTITDVPAHTHGFAFNVAYERGSSGIGAFAAGSTYDRGINTSSSGSASVDVTMPYIQLTYCQKTAGSDIAEWMPATGDISKETIVSADPDNREKAIISGKEYDGSVIGIVATKPGWLIGDETPGSVQLALAGRVPVRVSLKNGEIKPGDPITTSSIPGVGMKATKAGAIVGKAMEAVNETSATESCIDPVTSIEERCATALVFVNISWYSPTEQTEEDDFTSQVASSYFEPIGINGDLSDGDVADMYYDHPNNQNSTTTSKLGHIGRAEREEAQSLRLIAGVISTKIGGPGELLRRVRENNKIVSELRIISQGKAEMKISPDSGVIEPGDAIMRSRTNEGMGTLATARGFIIGRALEAWEPGSNKEKISVMIDASWYDPMIFERYAPFSATTSVAELLSEDSTIASRVYHSLPVLMPWIGSFKDASHSLQESLAELVDMPIHFLGRAVYAATGVFERLFVKELIATNVVSDKGTFKELCVGSVCVTEEQFMRVFGASQPAAAASVAPEPAPVESEQTTDQPAPTSEETAEETTAEDSTPQPEPAETAESPSESTPETSENSSNADVPTASETPPEAATQNTPASDEPVEAD